MEVWILFNEEVESSTAEAFEIRRFMAEGRNMGIDVKVFHPEQFDLLVTEEETDSILIDGKPVLLPDFMLPRTYVIETGYFPLAILRQFERLGVPVYNTASCIERVADKLRTHQILAEKGLPTPTTMLAKFPVDIDLVEEHIGFPVVVKTLLGVNGSGVFLIENREAFLDLMNLIGETNPNIQLIFQKFVAASKGRDLRVFIVNGKVIACMERRAAAGGFKANYSQGGSVNEFIIDEEAAEISIATADALDIQIAGIDLLFTEHGYTICEANTFPGFKGLETACDVNVPKEIFSAMLEDLEARGGPRRARLEA
jgi:gamma-F420-2:alpha-L-glutamate ligase|tara:strand:- start:72305 stop:73243 length:939 start_codon:yes stop_codon:yes gene_type:complete